MTAEPQPTDAMAKGAAGEAAAAVALERRVRGKGVVLLHDRALPRSRANFDHIAIGPGGTTVIDAKAVKGRVRIERRGGLFATRTDHLVVNGRDRTKLVEGVERQVDAVRAAFATVPVVGALCWMEVTSRSSVI